MQYMDDLEEQIDKLVKNTMGITVNKSFSRGILSAEIILPKEKLAKEITKEDIKFEIIIDSYSPTLYPVPRIYCLTPYCFPNLADGRDLFRELKNMGNFRNGELILKNLLVELMEFVKINFQRGGLLFCGNYFLDDRYETRFFNNKKCVNIQKVKQSLMIKGKKVVYARSVVLSDVNFLLFKKDKANKNSVILLFWSSFNNIEKVQKLSDNKTVILHWITQDKENNYAMNLSFEDRNTFLNELMERIKNCGMVFDVSKMNKQNEIEKREKFQTDSKFRNFEKEKENQNDIKNNIKKLNDYQVKITSLYGQRHELIRKRANIQLLINNETRKDRNSNEINGIGSYLMYVYNYYINLINQLQYKNRKYKIDNDIVRKDNQIKTLNKQIQLRDNCLKEIKQKLGNNVSYNIKRLIDIGELNMDPCVDIDSMERNNNLEQFTNNIIAQNNQKTMKRNISMPFLRSQANTLKNTNKKFVINNANNKINTSLPVIQKSNYFNKSKKLKTINNDSSSSIVKKRIPSGYLLRNQRSKFNNLKSNLFNQYKKYYNLYHISNNYHVGNFNAGNPSYNRVKNSPKKINNKNTSSLDFEIDYNNKVKTLLKKNYIFRFNNSPYSLVNI